MFQNVQMAPPDPILGLTEAFKQDPNPKKINLGVGVYKDATGNTPVMQCVKAAEQRILEKETSKSYKPIPGDPAYGKLVQELMFGTDHEIVTGKRAVTAHTPGGTGALRVAGDYLHQLHPNVTVWLSDPTWANHPKVFASAGVKMDTYNYYDAKANALDFDAMMTSLQSVPAGDVVLLHGCCHNPTGVDLSVEQWKQVGDLLAERGVIPMVDFAYQGLAAGIVEDGQGLLAICRPGRELIVCSSFSKNMGLYNERVGALTIIAADDKAAQAVFSNIKVAIRTNYSNPPSHGEEIVLGVLGDAALRKQWEGEVADIRQRINGIREQFANELTQRGVKLNPAGNDFIVRQNGMFSFSGLTKDQVEKLKKDYAIYIVGSGRINVAGITQDNIAYLCDAIAAVM